ncbi:MAG: hypothetical protein AB7V77_01615 [Candidatus Woesearchaeota archaeon]
MVKARKKQINEKAKDYLDKAEEFIKKNPLTSFVGAVVIGYAIGKLFHGRKEK